MGEKTSWWPPGPLHGASPRIPPFLRLYSDGAAGILAMGGDKDGKGIGTEELDQERQGPKGHWALPGWSGTESVGGTELEAASWVGVVSRVRGLVLHSWQDPRRRGSSSSGDRMGKSMVGTRSSRWGSTKTGD